MVKWLRHHLIAITTTRYLSRPRNEGWWFWGNWGGRWGPCCPLAHEGWAPCSTAGESHALNLWGQRAKPSPAEARENIHVPQPLQLGCPGREEAVTLNPLRAPHCPRHVSQPFIDKPRFCSSVLFPKEAGAGLFPQVWQGLLDSEAFSPLEKHTFRPAFVPLCSSCTETHQLQHQLGRNVTEAPGHSVAGF